ncbi:circularly permuted type 2 ATP-grasp protein [Geodermatophilus sp. SYSU D01186]
MADLFDGYPLGQQWDEMFGEVGQPRPAYSGLHTSLQPMAGEELSARADVLSQTYRDAGVTFAHAGEEQPFPLDIVPRVIGAEEWSLIERGVAQRVLALEAFLADVYGAGQVFADGVVPRSVVTTSAHFHRQAHGLVPPNGVRVHVSGIDLVRDEAGDFRVLEDNLRSPSGVSYVITNRAAMSQVLPELFADHRIQPVADYPTRLLAALKASAPSNVADPTVVVLTPGVYNSAYFEHALLARQMGVELVEGRDLVCAGNQVSMRTTDGQRRVDVIYRRIDDEFLDPVHFRPDSVIGCAGLLNAARAGRVTIANAVGNGVADDKLLYTWVPDLVRYYLAEEPLLANADTYRLDEPDVVAWVLDSLDQLVLKPVDGSGGKGIVIGPRADERTLEELAVKVRARPRDWIAQKPIGLSTCPTLVGGRIAPRHVDLRPFAVNDGEKVWVLPGGLTRVALPEGELVVNSSQGGGSKDTWVLSPPRPAAEADEPAADLTRIEFTTADLAEESPAPDPGPAGDVLVDQSQQQQQMEDPAFVATLAPDPGAKVATKAVREGTSAC